MSDATESEAPAIPRQPEWGRRRFLVALLASVLTCIGLSFYLLGPPLLYDLRRHEPWLLLGMLTGHLSSAFWFSQYYFAHFVLGRPLTNKPYNRRRAWVLSGVFISMVLALIVGLGFTCHVDVHDKNALEAGALTQGQLVEVDERGRSGRPTYFCYFEFADRRGELYSGLFLIRNARNPMLKKNQPALWQAIEARRLPVPVQVRYDPRRPSRNEAENHFGESVRPISVSASCCTGFLQSAVFLIFFLSLASKFDRGYEPWWADLYKVFPFAVQTFALLTVAALLT